MVMQKELTSIYKGCNKLPTDAYHSRWVILFNVLTPPPHGTNVDRVFLPDDD